MNTKFKARDKVRIQQWVKDELEKRGPDVKIGPEGVFFNSSMMRCLNESITIDSARDEDRVRYQGWYWANSWLERINEKLKEAEDL